MWYVYILECENKALYVGMTDNLDRRFDEHQTGKGGHYTAYSRPVKILYHEEFELRSDAENRECQIKRWTHEKKLALASGDIKKLKSLSISRD